jgi:hypothetical protein
MGRNARGTLPQLRLHKRSGTARVRVGHKEISLGRWGHPETHRKYSKFLHDFVQERTAAPEQAFDSETFRYELPPNPADEPVTLSAPAANAPDRLFEGALTVAELCARYMAHAQKYYAAPNGATTTTLGNAKMAIRALGSV